MLRLDFGNLLECIGDFGEALLFGYFGEVGIEHVPLLVLPFGCRQQVFSRGADPAGRITGRNLQIPAFEEFEETLRMLFFLIRSFRKNTCDLLVTLFLGYACEKRITSPCLALAGKCFEQVLLRPGTFNTFAHTENNLFVCVVDFSLQIYDKRTGKAIDNRYLFLMFALEFFISVAFCRRNIWTATNYVVFLIKYYTQFP